MIEEPLTAIVVISLAAFLCQWLAARLAMPSVLFLLAAGIALSGLIDPDELFGELVFTFVGLGVAILLFEGGSSLTWRRLQTGRQTVIRLVTIGALVAWVVGATAAALVLDVDVQVAILIGSILIVSGPTVVMPLLRVVRPREPTASILRWEGIVIDPIGAGLAIVVLDAIIEDRSPARIGLRVVSTFSAGIVVGLAVTALAIVMLGRRLIPDHLQVPAILAAVIASYGLANELRPESGLIAVTVLGLGFANQRSVPAARIVEFNENLGASVLGVLFIVLGARIDAAELVDYLPQSLAIVAALVLVGRPATVMTSTIGTPIHWRDRAFLMVLAPRGVVAAAVASLFALELEHHDIDPGPMVPVVFTVVVGTVALAGLTARLAALRLRIAKAEPRGVVLIGGGQFSIEFADKLDQVGVPSLHVGLDPERAEEALERGQLVYQSRLDEADFPITIEGLGIAHALVLSGQDHLDGFATTRLAALIGSENIHGPDRSLDEADPGTEVHLLPRPLLPATYDETKLASLYEAGAGVRVVRGPTHPRSGWLTICRIDAGRVVTFDNDPSNAGPDDLLVQLGPGLTTEED